MKGEVEYQPSNKIDLWHSPSNAINTYDAGFQFGFGITTDPFYAGLYFSKGLVNITPKSDLPEYNSDDFRSTNTLFGLKAGFYFIKPGSGK